jgi:transcriptional regulator with XRE-family HTH domain
MDQSISKQFNAALTHLLAKEGKGAQARLADQQNIDRSYLNHIVKGRNAGSDKARMKIADYFGITFEDMLIMGRHILNEAEKQTTVDRGEMEKNDKSGLPDSSTSDASCTEEGESSITLIAKPGKEEGICISEKIRKMVVILESDTTYRDVLASMIESFYEAVESWSENPGSPKRVQEMELHIADLEKKLADKQASRLQSA